jgi:hypothetical protein
MRAWKLLLTTTLCWVAAGAALAADAPAKHVVNVVKIMAFSCPVCRAAEAQDTVIERAAKSTGGSFVWAPVPSDATESGSKEMVYYASRSFSRELADKVKLVLYKGQQDLSIPLGEPPQVYNYFQQQLPDMSEEDFKRLFELGQGDAARKSLARAASLASSAGVQAVPTYILIVDGHPVVSLDPTTVQGGSLTVLRDEVINRINKLK